MTDANAQPVDATPRLADRAMAWLLRSGAFVPVAVFVLLMLLGLHRMPGAYDTDEGVNLIKSLMVSRGHVLYREVWSDQPPLLTYTLSAWAAVFGESAQSARCCIMLFSSLLAWAMFALVRRAASTRSAAVCVVLLLLSELYVRLSVSVMVGLPAIALALCAMALLVMAQGRWRHAIVAAAGTVFALSLLTKLFTAMLIPVALVWLLLPRDSSDEGKGAPSHWSIRMQGIDVALFAGGLCVTLGIALAMIGRDFVDQLLTPHVRSEVGDAWADQSTLMFAGRWAVYNLWWVLLAAVGAGWMLRHRWQYAVMPLAWFVPAMIIMLNHRPLWYHHRMLWTLPIVWLCGYGIEAGWAALCTWRDAKRASTVNGNKPLQRVPLIAVVGAIGVPALLIGMLFVQVELVTVQRDYGVTTTQLRTAFRFRPRGVAFEVGVDHPSHHAEPMAILRQRADASRDVVFTDRPFYAYQAGMEVPVELAVLTDKRLRGNSITAEQIRSVIERDKPRFIVLERFLQWYADEGLFPFFLERYKPIARGSDGQSQYVVLERLDTAP